jgi:hypothetical protein
MRDIFFKRYTAESLEFRRTNQRGWLGAGDQAATSRRLLLNYYFSILPTEANLKKAAAALQEIINLYEPGLEGVPEFKLRLTDYPGWDAAEITPTLPLREAQQAGKEMCIPFYEGDKIEFHKEFMLRVWASFERYGVTVSYRPVPRNTLDIKTADGELTPITYTLEPPPSRTNSLISRLDPFLQITLTKKDLDRHQIPHTDFSHVLYQRLVFQSKTNQDNLSSLRTEWQRISNLAKAQRESSSSSTQTDNLSLSFNSLSDAMVAMLTREAGSKDNDSLCASVKRADIHEAVEKCPADMRKFYQAVAAFSSDLYVVNETVSLLKTHFQATLKCIQKSQYSTLIDLWNQNTVDTPEVRMRAILRDYAGANPHNYFRQAGYTRWHACDIHDLLVAQPQKTVSALLDAIFALKDLYNPKATDLQQRLLFICTMLGDFRPLTFPFTLTAIFTDEKKHLSVETRLINDDTKTVKPTDAATQDERDAHLERMDVEEEEEPHGTSASDKAAFPKDYEKIWSDATLTDDMQRVRKLLEDYLLDGTPVFSTAFWRDLAHPKRHHCKEVRALLKRADLTTLEALLDEAFKIELIKKVPPNKPGSLEKRFAFINEKLGQRRAVCYKAVEQTGKDEADNGVALTVQ